MNPRRSPILLPALVSICLLSGCAAPSAPAASVPSEESGADEVGVDAMVDEAPAAATQDDFGCTDEMLAYLAGNGFADVPPADPATFAFPTGVDIAATPSCFVSEDDGEGASRSSALFFDDANGVLQQVSEAFAAAGWQGTLGDGISAGTGIWWSDGADVTAAEYSVGGGVLDIEGRQAAWFTWGY